MNHRLHALLIALVLIASTITVYSVNDTTSPPQLPIVVFGPASGKGMEPTIDLIKKHIGTAVYVKNIIYTSIAYNLYDQAEYFRKEVEIDKNLQRGFHVIAHSDKGLAVRYYIQRYNNPAVHTYISYGTPHCGIFGMPGTLDDHFKWLDALEEKMHKIIYTSSFQSYIPFASYWKDTLHHDKYLKYCSFLPYVNNELEHEYAERFKFNLSSLKQMILVRSEYEETIEPAASCHFGFYKKGSKTELEELCETDLYQNDTIGLATLHANGRLQTRFAKCPHASFPEDEDNFVENALPYLLPDQNNVAKGSDIQ